MGGRHAPRGRPGNNLFAESLVALDLKTGQRKWHFQVVHHPLWDFDLSSAPILADITVNGRAGHRLGQSAGGRLERGAGGRQAVFGFTYGGGDELAGLRDVYGHSGIVPG